MDSWIQISFRFLKRAAPCGRSRHVMSVLFLCVVLGLLSSGSARSQNSAVDPIEQSLRAYSAAVAEVRKNRATLSEQQQREHWQHWLDIFTSAIDSNPKSTFRRTAISKCVGLANSLGQIEISQKFSAMLSENGASLDQRLFWQVQEFLSARQEASKTHDETRTKKLLESLLTSIGEAKAEIRKGGANDSLVGAYIDACRAVESALRSIPGREGEADQLLEDAAQVAKPGVGGPDGLAIIGFIQSRFNSAVKKSDFETADRVFSELASHHKLLDNPTFSELLLRYADKKITERNLTWIAFVEGWLSKVKADRLTPVAQLEVGYELTNEHECKRALHILEPLRDNSVDVLAKLSGDRLRQVDGGLLGQLWYSLAIAYAQCGKIDSAKTALNNLKEIAPNHPRIVNVESQFVLQSRRSAMTHPSIPKSQKSQTVFWTVVGVNGIIVCAICFALLRRRRSGKGTV